MEKLIAKIFIDKNAGQYVKKEKIKLLLSHIKELFKSIIEQGSGYTATPFPEFLNFTSYILASIFLRSVYPISISSNT